MVSWHATSASVRGRELDVNESCYSFVPPGGAQQTHVFESGGTHLFINAKTRLNWVQQFFYSVE